MSDNSLSAEINRLNKKLERMKKRQWETLPEIIDSAPTVTQSDRKSGVSEQFVYVSAGVPNLVLRIDGVAWRVAMTSAY